MKTMYMMVLVCKRFSIAFKSESLSEVMLQVLRQGYDKFDIEELELKIRNGAVHAMLPRLHVFKIVE